jgi:hypothetical protein
VKRAAEILVVTLIVTWLLGVASAVVVFPLLALASGEYLLGMIMNLVGCELAYLTEPLIDDACEWLNRRAFVRWRERNPH